MILATLTENDFKPRFSGWVGTHRFEVN